MTSRWRFGVGTLPEMSDLPEAPTEISPHWAAWIRQQPMFFVATAPLAADGHVNCSPRGLDTLRVLDPKTVAWLDLTGSGFETTAHLLENGRIVLMFCSFAEQPTILRIHGRGRVHPIGSPEFDALRPRFPDMPGDRSILVIDVHRVMPSCGYSVPRMELIGERPKLFESAEAKGPEGLADYRRRKNRASLDGLPGPWTEPDGTE